jgi:hypothetical protein
MATADQLEEAAEDNKFGGDGIPKLGKEFNGEADVDFDDVAPDHMESLPSPVSRWFLGKLFD